METTCGIIEIKKTEMTSNGRFVGNSNAMQQLIEIKGERTELANFNEVRIFKLIFY